MSAPQSFCFCSKPANNRCSACKTVSYCSQECQRRDWQTHKKECRLPTPQVGTPNQIRELVRVGEKHTILRDTAALRLDPSLINGATALDFYTDTNSGLFWRLDQSDREQWEAKAEAHNRDSRRFWTTYLAPITTDPEWIDVVLDAVLNDRFTDDDPLWQAKVNGHILAALFPHLARFTPAQNKTLLEIFARRVRAPDAATFRLVSLTTEILFAHGEANADLVAQLVTRCARPACPASELDALLECVALPIQTYRPACAGQHILDLALVILSHAIPDRVSVPGDKILELADTSPTAFKHLLHAAVRICRERLVKTPAHKLLALFEAFGVEIRDPDTDALAWLFVELPEADTGSSDRLQRLLVDADDGRLEQFGLVARDDYMEALREPTRAAARRLAALRT